MIPVSNRVSDASFWPLSKSSLDVYYANDWGEVNRLTLRRRIFVKARQKKKNILEDRKKINLKLRYSGTSTSGRCSSRSSSSAATCCPVIYAVGIPAPPLSHFPHLLLQKKKKQQMAAHAKINCAKIVPPKYIFQNQSKSNFASRRKSCTFVAEKSSWITRQFCCTDALQRRAYYIFRSFCGGK